MHPTRWPPQLPRIVRHLADVGSSPPLDLVNALVAGAVGNGRAATTRELAELVYGLARMGRQVGGGSGAGNWVVDWGLRMGLAALGVGGQVVRGHSGRKFGLRDGGLARA